VRSALRKDMLDTSLSSGHLSSRQSESSPCNMMRCVSDLQQLVRSARLPAYNLAEHACVIGSYHNLVRVALTGELSRAIYPRMPSAVSMTTSHVHLFSSSGSLQMLFAEHFSFGISIIESCLDPSSSIQRSFFPQEVQPMSFAMTRVHSVQSKVRSGLLCQEAMSFHRGLGNTIACKAGQDQVLVSASSAACMGLLEGQHILACGLSCQWPCVNPLRGCDRCEFKGLCHESLRCSLTVGSFEGCIGDGDVSESAHEDIDGIQAIGGGGNHFHGWSDVLAESYGMTWDFEFDTLTLSADRMWDISVHIHSTVGV